MNNVEGRLKGIIIEICNQEISEADIAKESNLHNDFNFNSIEVIELIVEVENEFDVVIDDEDMDIDLLTNYETLLQMVRSKVSLPEEKVC